jgi:hypothetical protein
MNEESMRIAKSIFLILAFSLSVAASSALAEAPFDITTIPNEGRCVAAEFAELNGDECTDRG